MDFRDHSIVDLVKRIKRRELSAREVTEAALANIDRLNGQLNAFCAVDREGALKQAEQIDSLLAAGKPVGPLAGIPLGVKDMEDAAGFVSTYGSALHVNDPPASDDSLVVQRLRAAGCVVVGKTNTPEFGCKAFTDNVPFGASLNPWNTDRTAGGSSGGSAAALASGMVPLATGSDGGGSIRIPAAVCGFSAIKTTNGLVPLGGKRGSGYGILGVRGPMALTTADTAYALDSCVGHDPSDILSLPAPTEPWHPQLSKAVLPQRAIWSPSLGHITVDAEIAAICQQAINQLSQAGLELIENDRIWPENPGREWLVIWQSSCARMKGHLRFTDEWDKLDPDLRVHIEAGLDHISGPDYAAAMAAGHDLNLQLETAFTDAPLILTPTCAQPTPGPHGLGTVDGMELIDWVGFTPGFNLSRNPVGTLCCGFTQTGMPVGLQIIGRQHQDLLVLKAMHAFEQVFSIRRKAAIG